MIQSSWNIRTKNEIIWNDAWKRSFCAAGGKRADLHRIGGVVRVKKRIWGILVLIGILACGTVLMTGCGSQKEAGSSAAVAEEEPVYVPVHNPLTGVSEYDGFDKEAINQRIVSFVVENAPDARPQWGMTDEKYSPDIILQGEVEGGISRTLWMYADYNKLPEVIGPMRSARPPYIRFARLFDAIFFHWGKSHTEGGYIGANTVFHEEMVSHIDEMTFDDDIGLYGRDSSRAVSSEHTGILYGDKVPKAIKKKGFRETPNKFTNLRFYKKTKKVGKKALALDVSFSERSFENVYWNYDKEDHMYHTSHFENDLKRDNLLVLFDKTEYQEKTNYKGSGSSVVYCDYKLAGGKGQLLSQGKIKKIDWKVKNHKLILIDTKATKKAKEAAREAGKTEEEIEKIEVKAKMNQGKTWIGWVSSNHGGTSKVYND